MANIKSIWESYSRTRTFHFNKERKLRIKQEQMSELAVVARKQRESVKADLSGGKRGDICLHIYRTLRVAPLWIISGT
ncbi:hypothetical protein R1flu_018483, partial [Riccia fluitans]